MRPFDKDIGRFEVAVDDALSYELLAAGRHLLHDFSCVFLVQSARTGELGLECAALAELGHYVEVVLGLDSVLKLYNIRTLPEFLQLLDLGLGRGGHSVAVGSWQWDHLYGDGFR